ncbi:MAG: hypothetical protein ACRYFR_15330 [Janthinobacterium lividum]
MKILLLCLLLSNLAQAHQRLAAAPDSVPGQSRLVVQVAAEVCQQMSAAGSPALAVLSPAQAMEKFESALSVAIENHAADVRRVAIRTKNPKAYNQLRADLPNATALRLTKTCAAAAVLYSRFGRFLDESPVPTAAEKQFVHAWSSEFCQHLTALNQEGRFQGKLEAERVVLFEQEFSASLAAQGPKIAQLYGGVVNENQAVTQKFLLMLVNEWGAQIKESCPQLMRLLNSAK